MMRSSLLLLACLTLVMQAAGEAEADDWEMTIDLVGSYDTDGDANDVTISGNYAYVADKSNGLVIINIEDPANPTFVGSYDTDEAAFGVTISGNYAYVADGFGGLVIVNIEDPTNPTLAGSYDTDDWASHVIISGNYAYVADLSNGLIIINIEDPTNPTLAGSYDTNSARGVTISGNYAYVADSSKLVILNIEDPANPTFVGSYDTDDAYNAMSVIISGNYAYLANSANGLVIVNIEDPTNPTLAGSYDTVFTSDVTISGNYAYVAAHDNGLVMLNIEDPANPTWVGSYNTTGYARGVIFSGNYAYVADDENGLVILESSGYAPIVVIDSIYPSPARFDEEISFSGSGEDYDGIIVAYEWTSSRDGELSTERNFTTTNLSFGLHSIILKVTDNDGASTAVNQELGIYASPVAIAGQDSTGTPGVPLQFSGAGTDEDGTVVLYEWDFDGDGVFEWSSTENGLNTYIYNNEDTYTATLRVTDNDGFTDTDAVEVTISEKKIQIDDEGNVTVTDAEEDEEGIPTLSVITIMTAVAVMALRRRPE